MWSFLLGLSDNLKTWYYCRLTVTIYDWRSSGFLIFDIWHITYDIWHLIFNQWTNRPMDQWTNGPMEQWTDGPMDQWTNGPMDQWTDRPIDQWTNGPMDFFCVHQRVLNTKHFWMQCSLATMVFLTLTQLVDRLCDCNIAIFASTLWGLLKSSWNMKACASVGRNTSFFIDYFFLYMTMIWVMFWGWKISALISICFRIKYQCQGCHWAGGRKKRETSKMILDSTLKN